MLQGYALLGGDFTTAGTEEALKHIKQMQVFRSKVLTASGEPVQLLTSRNFSTCPNHRSSMWPLSDPSISLVANFTSLKQNTEVVELFKETIGIWAVSLDNQSLCDGQVLVHLLTFNLCKVFFREMVVCAEGWQPAPLGAVPASPASHGARRNRETAESSKEQTRPELEGDGKSIWRNKTCWAVFAMTKKPWSWLKQWLRESISLQGCNEQGEVC